MYSRCGFNERLRSRKGGAVHELDPRPAVRERLARVAKEAREEGSDFEVGRWR